MVSAARRPNAPTTGPSFHRWGLAPFPLHPPKPISLHYALASPIGTTIVAFLTFLQTSLTHPTHHSKSGWYRP